MGNDPYTEFVEHPRFGRGPRLTGIDIEPGIETLIGSLTLWLFGEGASPHWRIQFNPSSKVPDTGVLADRSKHGDTDSNITHYFDEKRTCQTCGRDFIFFAEEQKHWYEELGFYLAAEASAKFEISVPH